MIETTITKIQYDADGVQRRWSIPFPYADVKHISIYTKVGEEPTVKVVDNYDIDEDDSVVIYPTVASGQEPVAAGTKIIIARETPETQLEDASQVHFTSKDVERGLDKLTMITQEISTTANETMEVSAAAFEAAEEAVNSAAQANQTAEEAKTIAGQAVGIATDAKSIAEGIDAKATEALTNSNTAINTANSAKETAENIDDKATQALTNSNTAVSTANSAKQIAESVDGKATQALANSTTALEKATEAKNTADSYQGQITTIESKIPDDATEQNKLVTKTQMETAVAGSSGFDFEGTKAEFDAAVAAGTITEDSVSLITDDVSGDNVATKADLVVALNERADKQLSNTNLITNCILSAPNGVMQVSSTDPYTLTINKGLKVALANGYNADGTPKSEIVTLENDISITIPSTTNYNWPIYVILVKPISDGAFRITVPSKTDFASVKVIPSNIPTNFYKLYYCTNTNTFYEHSIEGSLSEYKGVLLGFGKFVDSKFTDMVPYKPIQLSLEGFGDYVVESQVNSDGSWYRKYKSGWLEQGGLVTVSGTVGATVTLLKPFANTAYNIQLTLQTTNVAGYLAGTAQSVNISNSKTTTSFGVQTAGIHNYEINGISWRAEGQGA